MSPVIIAMKSSRPTAKDKKYRKTLIVIKCILLSYGLRTNSYLKMGSHLFSLYALSTSS